MEEQRRIRAALVGHSDQVFDFVDVVANRLAFLGSKVEWSTTISAPPRIWFGSLRRDSCKGLPTCGLLDRWQII